VICSCGISFDPVVSGRRLSFGFHGLYQGTAVLYDQQTGSLWMIVTGECFAGELKGTVLKRFPTGRHTVWRDWRSEHPETDVMRPDPALARPGRGRPGYFSRSGARSGSSYFPPEFHDTIHADAPRLQPHALVYGVVVDGEARAYPFSELRRRPVVEEPLGEVPATIWFDRTSRSAGAFDRRLGERILSFEMRDDGRIEDRDTGSGWNLEGECRSGPLEGGKLEPLHGLMAEWYAWFAHHPRTTVWTP
jgi:hypothetical protein